jgi:hypothetical protein
VTRLRLDLTTLKKETETISLEETSFLCLPTVHAYDPFLRMADADSILLRKAVAAEDSICLTGTVPAPMRIFTTHRNWPTWLGCLSRDKRKASALSFRHLRLVGGVLRGSCVIGQLTHVVPQRGCGNQRVRRGRNPSIHNSVLSRYAEHFLMFPSTGGSANPSFYHPMLVASIFECLLS